jgi:hypothetical protein
MRPDQHLCDTFDLIMIDWRGQMTRFATDEFAAFIGLEVAPHQTVVW